MTNFPDIVSILIGTDPRQLKLKSDPFRFVLLVAFRYLFGYIYFFDRSKLPHHPDRAVMMKV